MRRSRFAASLAILMLPCAGSARAEPQRKDPFTAFRFAVKIERLGLEQDTAFFESVSGLKAETDVVEYREGGSGEVRKIPGRTRVGNLVLTRPFLEENGEEPIQPWVRAVESGQDVRKKVTIVYFTGELTEVARCELAQCFPVRWEIGALDPSKNEPAIEAIEIAHQGLKMIPPPAEQPPSSPSHPK